MKALKLTPMLWTENLQETIDFYTNTLGFICDDKNDEWGWAAMHHGDIDVMVAKPNEHTPYDKIMFSGSFYFTLENVNELWEELKDKCTIAYPIENFEWEMREFAIFDNNGYMLQFGQDISERQ